MSTDSTESPRIVIYGVGQYGQYIVRFAAKKGWKIVAAFNRAGEKIGQDIGRLAMLDYDLGVIVQDCDLADYGKLDAEIGIVAVSDRIAENLTAYKRLMTAGLNVICHGGEAYYPIGADPEIAAEIEQIAQRNNVSFLGTGIWDMSRTWSAFLVAGPCTDIRSLFHLSVTNSEGYDKATVLATGTGMSIDEFEEKIGKPKGRHGGLFKLVPQHVLTGLGYTVISCSDQREPITSSQAFYSRVLEYEIAPGLCLGTRTVIEVRSKEGVTATAHMEVRPLIHSGEVERAEWAVEGEPSNKVIVERGNAPYTTAASMFNRIQDVIAAPPGIQLIWKLGPMKHTALI